MKREPTQKMTLKNDNIAAKSQREKRSEDLKVEKRGIESVS